jgi:hypothetical protein
MESKDEPLRRAVMTLAVSVVIAATIIGWSLPDAPKPQKYEVVVADGKIVRLDTREGHIVACDFSRCVRVLGNGKAIQPNSAPGLITSQGAAPPPGGNEIPAPAE